MLTLVVVLKALLEIAGLALLGQGVLYVLAGAGRDRNLFYGVLRTLTSPAMRLARVVTPRAIPDGQLGWVAFALIAGLWLAVTIVKIKLVIEQSAGVTP
jgi:hypothetical protein